MRDLASMITTVTLSSWDEIHPYESRRGWLFRGERTTGWEPKTSLERCYDRLGAGPKMRRTIEGRIIREFRRAYHQFSARVPERESIVEWLSIMQHHGAPTRLLDFTYSVYVGAYFALEEAEGDQGDISMPFLDNLRALGAKPTNSIVRIVIPESLRIAALRQLWSMDISRAALFPGWLCEVVGDQSLAFQSSTMGRSERDQKALGQLTA